MRLAGRLPRDDARGARIGGAADCATDAVAPDGAEGGPGAGAGGEGTCVDTDLSIAHRQPVYAGDVELQEIDERLQRYSAAEQRVAANLSDLQQNAAYIMLTTDTLKGITGRRLNGPLSATPGLWEMFNELQTTISRAHTLRGSSNRLKAAERKAIGEVLNGRSVYFRTEAAPLASRDLLGGTFEEERVTIDEMLQLMQRAYEPIRDGVADVENVMSQLLPRVNAAARTLEWTDEHAAALGLTPPELREAHDRVRDLRRRATDDPLSIPSNAGDEIERLAEAAAAQVSDFRQSRNDLQSDLSGTGRLLGEIRDVRERAERARVDCLARIAHPVGIVRVPGRDSIDGPNGLAAKRDSIVASTAPWQELRVMVDDWTDMAERFRDQLRRALGANRVGLEHREELRGRLSAYRAKMAGLARDNDPVLIDMADEVHNELFTAPTDLGRAEQILGAIGQHLSKGNS